MRPPTLDMDGQEESVHAASPDDVQARFPPPALMPSDSAGAGFDVENKSKKFNVLSFASPHHRAFHLSWMAFAAAFISTFAPAALLPQLRDDLDLTSRDISNSAVASVCGSILSRVLMGTFVDRFGSRCAAAVSVGQGPMLLRSRPARTVCCCDYKGVWTQAGALSCIKAMLHRIKATLLLVCPSGLSAWVCSPRK